MMMFTPGCLENQTASSATGPSGPCDLFETTPSNTSGSVTGVGMNETSEVTLVVSHAADGTNDLPPMSLHWFHSFLHQ